MKTAQWLLAPCLAMAFPVVASEPSAVEILDRWDAGVKLIESYDLRTKLVATSYIYSAGKEIRLVRPDEHFDPLVYRARIYRSAGKRRGEFGIDDAGRYSTDLIYDGKLYYSSMRNSGQVDVNVAVLGFGSMEYEDYEALYRVALGTSDRIALSKQRGPRLLPREGKLYVVDVPAANGGDYANLRWRVWLDPDRNFLPARWSQWFSTTDRDMHDRDCELRLKEVTPGVWAPIEGTIKVYGKGKSDDPLLGKQIGTNVLSVDEEHSRFNVSMPDDLFEPKVPDGTRVIDRVRNVVYTQGAADPDKFLSDIAAKGRAAVDKLTPEQKAMPPFVVIPDRRISWVVWVSGSVVVILAVVGGAFFFRRRAAKEPGR